MTATTPCTVCRAPGPRTLHEAREMLNGTREVFHYAECGACGYLELVDPPRDFGPYYAGGYYSMQEQSPLKSYLKAVRGADAFGRKSLLSRLLVARYGYPPVVEWLQRIGARPGQRVLDVGCGQGIALRDLARAGFAALHGADPFLERERHYGPVHLQKKTLAEITERYDIVLLNHSFEHLPDQAGVLRELGRIVAPGGWLIVRMPIVGRAWRTWGVHWYGLDPPRHLAIHTPRSFELLVAESPFSLERTDHDTDEHHELASRQYVAGIPLTAATSYMAKLEGSLFTPDDVAKAQAAARAANAANDGDQATFYLKPKA